MKNSILIALLFLNMCCLGQTWAPPTIPNTELTKEDEEYGNLWFSLIDYPGLKFYFTPKTAEGLALAFNEAWQVCRLAGVKFDEPDVNETTYSNQVMENENDWNVFNSAVLNGKASIKYAWYTKDGYLILMSSEEAGYGIVIMPNK